MYVTHRKEAKEGVQLWIEGCRQAHKGIGNSTILFDEPDETLYINPEGILELLVPDWLITSHVTEIMSFDWFMNLMKHYTLILKVLSPLI